MDTFDDHLVEMYDTSRRRPGLGFSTTSKSNVFAKMELENAKKSGMSVKIAS